MPASEARREGLRVQHVSRVDDVAFTCWAAARRAPAADEFLSDQRGSAPVHRLLLTALLVVPFLVLLTAPAVFDQLVPPAPRSTQPQAANAVPLAARSTSVPVPGTALPLDTLREPTLSTGTRLEAPAQPPPGEPQPTSTPTPTRERVLVANTGGRGGVLRAAPVSGRQVAALRERQVLEVLERTSVQGAEWVHVRTDTAVDGWIAGAIVEPVPSAE